MTNNYNRWLIFLISILLDIFLITCEKLEIVRLIKIVTLPITEYNSTTAALPGTIIDLGEGIKEYGHYWWQAGNETTPLKTVYTNAKTGNYTSKITNLQPATAYYFKAYALNSGEPVFGKVLSFSTMAEQTEKVTSITVIGEGGASTIISLGGMLQLYATVLPENATNKNVTWSVTNGTGQATIDSTGLVTAVAYGTITARATANDGSGVFGTLIITISGQTIKVTSINVTGEGGATTISFLSSTLQLYAIILPDNATNKTITWSVINGTGQATINSSGLVTAVADGMVTARATANDGSGVYGTLIITISGQIVKVTSITVTGEGGVNTIATLGGILQLYAILLPDNANNKSVTWSVTNSTGQATINSTGLVTAVAYGTVTARATANDGSGIFGSLAITILEPSGTIHDTRDNHDYKWVRIGNQVWMAENLAYVPAVSPPTVGSDTESYYYVYDYYGSSVSEAKATYNYAVYGILYNWTAAVNGATSSNTNPSGVQGACPSGWHLPSDAEWTELANYLGGFGAAGGKLKEVSYTHWFNPNTSATNESGFTALPGGYRFEHGSFCCLGGNGGWWSSTNYGTTSSWWIGLSYSYEWVDRNYYFNSGGYSIRCISDY